MGNPEFRAFCNDNVITVYSVCCLKGDLAMATSPREKAKRNTLNLRITAELRGLIDQAADLSGKNRTDFVLEAARHAAEDTLLDRTVFMVDPKAYAAFVALLDAPPRPNDRLRRSLQTAAPWEK
jgi:uncharacterized protein (DUF1778 family)